MTNNPVTQPSGYGSEAEMDTQQISSMGQTINMQVWYREEGIYEVWLQDAINAGSAGPRIWSVSYASVESELGKEVVEHTDTLFLQLTATGVSILFAAGDNGAGGKCKDEGPFEPFYCF